MTSGIRNPESESPGKTIKCHFIPAALLKAYLTCVNIDILTFVELSSKLLTLIYDSESQFQS